MMYLDLWSHQQLLLLCAFSLDMSCCDNPVCSCSTESTIRLWEEDLGHRESKQENSCDYFLSSGGSSSVFLEIGPPLS